MSKTIKKFLTIVGLYDANLSAASLNFYLRPAPAAAVWLAAADCGIILYLNHQELKS